MQVIMERQTATITQIQTEIFVYLAIPIGWNLWCRHWIYISNVTKIAKEALQAVAHLIKCG